MNDKSNEKITLRNRAKAAADLHNAETFKEQVLYQHAYKEAVKVYSTMRFGQKPDFFYTHAEARFNGQGGNSAITLRFKPREYLENSIQIAGFNLQGTCPHCGKNAWSQDLFDLTELGHELAKEVFEPEGMHLATHNPISKRQLIGQHWGAIRAIIMEKK